MKNDYFTVSETAKKLGVSPRTVQRYCRDGRLKHKWIQGKRHTELRILPPIQTAQLPCGRRKNIAGTFDYMTVEEFADVRAGLENRIARLETELKSLKSTLSGGAPTGTVSHGANHERRLAFFLHEFEQVRPAEKKLILKIARELKAREDRMDSPETDAAGDSDY